MDWHPYYYKSGLWNLAQKWSDVIITECHGLMTAIKWLCNYIYAVKFFVESYNNRLVH